MPSSPSPPHHTSHMKFSVHTKDVTTRCVTIEKIVFCDFFACFLRPTLFFYGEAYQKPRRNCFAGKDVFPTNRPVRGLRRGSPRNNSYVDFSMLRRGKITWGVKKSQITIFSIVTQRVVWVLLSAKNHSATHHHLITKMNKPHPAIH
jgi:hypothetical protein